MDPALILLGKRAQAIDRTRDSRAIEEDISLVLDQSSLTPCPLLKPTTMAILHQGFSATLLTAQQGIPHSRSRCPSQLRYSFDYLKIIMGRKEEKKE